ncbi:TorF family putative porin [Shewanella sp. Isolate7]|uniref:TorF family putative porin n=1 Tax=Shewanella sp. Isolate7 TaxID=2908528 RepID=UPI001EFC5D2D|nr:TorF family putative porin [Shewanella sp. Isolate7]MCG9722386.1 TorF family putative porin [Shewanella sp. Isolate7]
MNKIILSSCALAIACTMSQPLAAEESQFAASGVLMGLSNYLWRGQTISDNKPTLQGDLMVEHESGFYLGTSFETYRYEDEGSVYNDYEIDYYGGYYQMLTEDLGLGFNAMKYTYGAGGYSVEYSVSLDYKALNLMVNYDQDVEAWYTEVNYGFDLFNDSQLVAHAGLFTDAENYGYLDKGKVADSIYDVGLRYRYPLLSQLDLMLEISYQEFEHDHYMIGLAYNF